MKSDNPIENLQEQIKRLEKLASEKAEIVSSSAHQIRTSLSASRWIIKMFLDGDVGKLTVEQEELMQKAYEDNLRAIETVSGLLSVNKEEEIEKEKYNFGNVDLRELVDDSIFDFSGESHNHEVEIIFLPSDKKISPVWADREKLRIVLQNLLENAIKYSDKGGKVFVALKEENDLVEFSVKNSGTIISEEGKNKIFGKFYRDPEAKKKEALGTGIGLFTAKKIIENHKGKIWFESNKERGTTMFFTIPSVKNPLNAC